MKNLIRKYIDQSFDKMQHLTSESLLNFTQSDYNFKLWRMFWLLLALYKDGVSYEEVLQSLLIQKSQGTA
jgi:hypothetical protein